MKNILLSILYDTKKQLCLPEKTVLVHCIVLILDRGGIISSHVKGAKAVAKSECILIRENNMSQPILELDISETA